MDPPSLEFMKLEVHHESRTALLKYNRPFSGNSLHPKLLKDAVTAMHWIESQQSIRVVVVTGEGKFFCTGMELLKIDGEGMSFAIGSDFHELNRIHPVEEGLDCSCERPCCWLRNEQSCTLRSCVRSI